MQKKKKEENWEKKSIDNEEDSQKNFSKNHYWLKKEGELAVDVYETEKDLVIQAPIGGVKKEDLEIITEKDMVIIKGKRERPEEEVKEFYTKECFYGNFRREVVLPEETDPSRLEADIKEGVLTVRAPKIER
jgi:HSP20 family protein